MSYNCAIIGHGGGYGVISPRGLSRRFGGALSAGNAYGAPQTFAGLRL